MAFAKEYPEFITTTCLEWKPILQEEAHKNIVIDSLRFLSRTDRVRVYAFVIMDNHFHLIWQMVGDHKRQDVQRDFLKYTSQQILKLLRNLNSPILSNILVTARDRKYQVWERNSLSISLVTESVFMQKFNYVHNNPVAAGLCELPEQYRYSSAGFYYLNKKDWDFLVHYDG